MDTTNHLELEFIEMEPHLSVFGIGVKGELAIKYLADNKVENTNLCIINHKEKKTVLHQSGGIKQLALSSFESDALNKLLNDECVIILVVDSECINNLKLAIQIGEVLKKQKYPVISVILNEIATEQERSISNEMYTLINLSNSYLVLPTSKTPSNKVETNVLNSVSSLIELILYDFPTNMCMGIDHADVITILSETKESFNNNQLPINICYGFSTNPKSIYAVFNNAISRIKPTMSESCNVLVHVRINIENYKYEELTSTLEKIREQYKGDCYLAPKHDANINNKEVHVTAFIT